MLLQVYEGRGFFSRLVNASSDLVKLQDISVSMKAAVEDLSRELQVQSLEEIRAVRGEQATQFAAINAALTRLEAFAASYGSLDVSLAEFVLGTGVPHCGNDQPLCDAVVLFR